MSRPKRREGEPLFDPELAELPEGARWREWLGRVELEIFAARRRPCRARRSPRSSGENCNLDDLLADIRRRIAPASL